MNKIVAATGIILLALIGYVGYQQFQNSERLKQITSFESCAAAGFPVRESYPAQCSTTDGRSFTQDIGNELSLSDLIVVNNPRPNQSITSPVTIQGRARGTWFFEATFPIELVDANNKSLAKGFATAKGEWMTEDFVDFSAELTFGKPETAKGTLIITNANPSGLPENEKKLLIPINF